MNRRKALLLFILGIILIAVPLTILVRERIDARTPLADATSK